MVTTEPRADPHAAPAAEPAWLKALFLTPALVGSFCTLVLLGQSKGVRQAVAGWFGRRPDTADLDAVRQSVLGQGKRRVTALFGPPPAATSAPTVTWYYPVPQVPRTAMAVSFDGDRAVQVEFVRPPG